MDRRSFIALVPTLLALPMEAVVPDKRRPRTEQVRKVFGFFERSGKSIDQVALGVGVLAALECEGTLHEGSSTLWDVPLHVVLSNEAHMDRVISVYAFREGAPLEWYRFRLPEDPDGEIEVSML